MIPKTVLVTGGSGFVGGHVCKRLVQQGCKVRVPVRGQMPTATEGYESVETGDLRFFANWKQLVHGVDAIVHLVARTHVTDEFGNSALQEYRATNVDITRRLAKAAAQEGVKKFVYLSSIKAVGNTSTEPLTEESPCEPVDSYGITKREAEQAVSQLLGESACSYTILRPPLVYGPGVKGNFLRLLKMIQRGVPLPSVANQRSMVHVENLVDVICLSLDAATAHNEVFHVADSQPISTSDLVQHMSAGMGRSPRLIPLPQVFLTQLGSVIGKRDEIRRFVDSLVVSNKKATERLPWNPRYDTPTAVKLTAQAYAAKPWSTQKRSMPHVMPTQRAA